MIHRLSKLVESIFKTSQDIDNIIDVIHKPSEPSLLTRKLFAKNIFYSPKM
jgi:hypothetical protein